MFIPESIFKFVIQFMFLKLFGNPAFAVFLCKLRKLQISDTLENECVQ